MCSTMTFIHVLVVGRGVIGVGMGLIQKQYIIKGMTCETAPHPINYISMTMKKNEKYLFDHKSTNSKIQ